MSNDLVHEMSHACSLWVYYDLYDTKKSSPIPGNTKGGSIVVLLTSCLTGLNHLYDNWQFLFLFAKQTNPNQSNRRSSDTSPFSIPCLFLLKSCHWLRRDSLYTIGLMKLFAHVDCHIFKLLKIKFILSFISFTFYTNTKLYIFSRKKTKYFCLSNSGGFKII